MNQPIRIAHMITTLEYGGAENMLFKIASRIAADRNYRQLVISLTGEGIFGPRLTSLGVPVMAAGLEVRGRDLTRVLQLAIRLRRFRPHLLQTWLYHADFLGTCVAPFLNPAKLIWNIRCSAMAFDQYAITTRLVFQFLRRMSIIPAVVCANSQAGILHHQRRGYRPRKWVWIPNGFDTGLFRPRPDRFTLRERLGISPHAPLIGMVARFDPMKDLDTFFRAAKRLLEKTPQTHFVLIGYRLDADNPDLRRIIERYQIDAHVHLLGRQDDLHLLYPQMDIFTLTSLGEGFPNVIGEAMACGVPCVATDVGDVKLVIGDTGFVVAPKDADRLAGAWNQLVQLDKERRIQMGRAARRRIVAHYSLDTVQRTYLDLYEQTAAP